MNTDEISQYIQKRIEETGIDKPALEELNGFIAEWTQIKNSSPDENFEGYSPIEMFLILHHLLREDCPVQLAEFTDETCNSIPLFRQVKMLLTFIEKEGELKLTQTGNLPVRIVKDIYSAGVSDSLMESGILNLRSENDSFSVQLTRAMSQLMKVIKKRNNKLSLTKKGKEFLSNDSKLSAELLTIMLTRLNLNFLGVYPFSNIGTLGIGFSLVLLNKYGQTDREDTFYAEKYFKAFPSLLEEASQTEMSQKTASNCYSLRVFNVLFRYLGLVSIDETDRYNPGGKKIIHRTDIFEKIFLIKQAN